MRRTISHTRIVVGLIIGFVLVWWFNFRTFSNSNMINDVVPILEPTQRQRTILEHQAILDQGGREDPATATPPFDVSLQQCVDAKKNVLLVGNRPVGTYICDYFPNAKHISGGCQLQCPPRYVDSEIRLIGSTPFTCTILRKGSEAQMRSADVVVSHYGAVPRKFSKLEPVYTIFYSGESNATEAKRSKESYQQQYDSVVSFHTHRQWFFTWTHRHLQDFLSIAKGTYNFGLPWEERRNAIAIFVSRCNKGNRETVINNLKSVYPVHSFGKCLRTHSVETEFPQCHALAGKGRYPSKLCVLQQYKFVLALDNTREEDYVTEKVYHALLAGAVPLYDGAPNADEYLPDGWNSVVRLEEFEVRDRSYDAPRLSQALQNIEHNKDPQSLFHWRSPSSVLKEAPPASPSAPEEVEEETRTALSSMWGATFVDRMFHQEPTCEICDAARAKKCRG